MQDHECQEARYCCCDIMGTEPSEDCPMHGWPWPPRCEICGRFMKWSCRNIEKDTPREYYTIGS